MADLCSIAKKASKKATASGNAKDHRSAQVANERASKLAAAEGDSEKSQKHAKAAEDHRLMAVEAASTSDSSSNPLLSWTKAKV